MPERGPSRYTQITQSELFVDKMEIMQSCQNKEFRKNWARLIKKIYPVKFPKGNPIEQGK